MKLPKMILFDFGQTIMTEPFDGVKGTAAVMKYAVSNKFNLTPQQVQEKAVEINNELGRFNPKTAHLFQVEVPNSMFQPYLYESLGIEINLSPEDKDRIFWDNAAPGKPTEGIREFLDFLWKKKIRTGVITNICYDPVVVNERLNKMVPDNHFEFVLCTSQYIFRKPNRRIFDLALLKADLPAEDVWYIGDNYECDVKGSMNAGMTPVWYKGALRKPSDITDDSVLSVESWNELTVFF